MVSNPTGRDDTARRKPVTIDLAAEEVGKPAGGAADAANANPAKPGPDASPTKPGADAAASEPVTPSAFAPGSDRAAEPPAPRARVPLGLLAGTALAGGIVGALLVWALAASGTLPTSSSNSGIAALRTELADLRTRVEQVPAPEDLTPLREEVAALAGRPDSASPEALSAIEARVAALESRPEPAPAGEPAGGGDLAARLDSLAAEVERLKGATTAPQAPAPDPAVGGPP